MSQARTQARRAALQGLYQWQLSGNDVFDIEKHILESLGDRKLQKSYLHELLFRVVEQADNLDSVIAPLLDRSISQLDPVERNVLRIGAYELTHKPEVPVRTVINESIELAKRFGAEQGHKFVNGVLDKLAKQIRSAELNIKSNKT